MNSAYRGIAAATAAVVALVIASESQARPPAPTAYKKESCPTAVERALKVIKDGVTHKGEIVGDRLMLFAADGRSAPAPDGTYLMPNGEKIVVKQGKVQKAASAKAG